MLNKYLEKKVTVVFEDESYKGKSPMELEYYLTESDKAESEKSELNEFFHEKQYGIEIVKIVNGSKVEEKLVRNLTCCRQEAKEILKKFIYNTVTPMSMLFILDDILGT
jgi:hypothetical protein